MLKVCPDCGNARLRVTLTTRTEYVYEVYEDGTLFELEHDLVDGGDQDEIELLECDDCGNEYAPDELVSREEYDRE